MSSFVKWKDDIVTNTFIKWSSQTLPVYTLKGTNMDIINWFMKVSPCHIGSTYHFSVSKPSHGYEIYGDNLDYTVHTYHRTKENKGQDIHWFLMLYAKRRVEPPMACGTERPIRDIRN